MCNVSRSNLRTFLKVLPSLNPCDNPSFATNPISKFGFLTIVFCCCKNCKISNILSKIILLRHSGNVVNLSVRSRANKIRCKITHSKAIFEACSLLLLLIPLRPSKKCYKRIFWGYQLEPQRPKRPFSLLLWIFYPTTATLSSFSTNDEKQLNADVRYKRCQQCGQERLDYLFKNWNICISENLPKWINNCHSRFKILPNIK